MPSYKTLSGAECLFRFAHAMLSFSGRAAPHSQAMFRHACAIWAVGYFDRGRSLGAR